MTPIDECTHYEFFEVAANASSSEIQNAYKEMLAMYGADSLSTYSLFTPRERERILGRAESVFQILMDEEKRNAYDKSLLTLGGLSPEMPG